MDFFGWLVVFWLFFSFVCDSQQRAAILGKPSLASGYCCRCPGSCLEGNCMNLAKSNWAETSPVWQGRAWHFPVLSSYPGSLLALQCLVSTERQNNILQQRWTSACCGGAHFYLKLHGRIRWQPTEENFKEVYLHAQIFLHFQTSNQAHQ